MSLAKLSLRSLAHHWRTNFAVALGVMAATAVLTGALVVGDSMQGSLRHLIVDRLGQIDSVLVTPRFFRTELVQEIAAKPGFDQRVDVVLPATVLEGTLENVSSSQTHRAGNVSLFGIGEEFWKLGRGGPKKSPQRDEIVLNQPLADELHIKPGDEVILRLPQADNVPADSPLGRKTETVRSQRFTVSEIIPAEGLGRFGLRASQQTPLNAYTAIKPLEQMLDVRGRVNAIFSKGDSEPNSKGAVARERGRYGWVYLNASIRPTLADYGLTIRKTDRGYFNLTTDRMVLEPAVEQAAMKAFGRLGAQPAYTYLANYISVPNREGKIPYSTVAAVDFTGEPPLGPFINREGQPIGPLADDEIVLNSWAADDLERQFAATNPSSPSPAMTKKNPSSPSASTGEGRGEGDALPSDVPPLTPDPSLARGKEEKKLKPGDTIELTYFEPESTHGEVKETTHAFRLKDIVKLEGAADDRDFTPEVKGVTDEESIASWDPPFPYDSSRVRSTPPHDEDDKYWKQYRATPKAFISLAQGRKLWGSRFGNITSIRIPNADHSRVSRSETLTVETLTTQLENQLSPSELGFEFLPIKRLGLEAAAGTTPFAGLFLAFSFFIIVAALMLVMLLFKLGVDSRAAELGIVLAVGWRRTAARRMYLFEGAAVAAIGALAGVALGVGYAWLMLAGLKTWWLGAITTPFLDLYVTPATLAIGYLSGLLVSLVTIAWSLRQLRKVTVRRLLAGQSFETRSPSARRSTWPRWFSILALLAAIACGVAATKLTDESQALAFLGSGSLVLTAILVWIWNVLRSDSRSPLVGRSAPLVRLAVRNSSRFPLRSTLTIGLTAAACFLIASLSAFQLAPSQQGPKRDSGDGGFALMAQSDQPIFQDLNSVQGRQDLAFDPAAQKLFAPLEAEGKSNTPRVFPLRVQSGDDASCLNLYQPRQPRILGVPPAFVERGGFAWAAGDNDPWKLLTRKRLAAEPIPIVLDQNTALYSLHLYGGAGEIFEIDSPRGGKLKLQVVGLLKNSIFQGDLLMSEANFLRLFPETSGYRMFLVESPPSKADEVAAALESNLGDYGFDTQTTSARLAEFFAVQNAYLATFRSLGGLGLLLGTFGLATVQLRNVVERRGELALLRAAGFRRRRLAQMVMLENAWLLVGGLAAGTIAALVALLPHLLSGGAGIPWLSLVAMLLTVLIVGLLAGYASVRAVLNSPLLPALRGS